jgi:hypothetical protein
MGFTPSEVDQMGFWEFSMARQGFAAHQGAKAENPVADIDESRMREMGIVGM